MNPMLLDEEALANQQSQIQPGLPQQAPAPPEGTDPEMGPELASASRPASPEEEKMFGAMVKQALQFLTTKESGDYLLATAKAKGPEAALAEVVGEALAGIGKAAESAGVQLPPEVKGAAAQAASRVLAALMAKGGMTKDPQALADAAVGMLEGEQDGVPAG